MVDTETRLKSIDEENHHDTCCDKMNSPKQKVQNLSLECGTVVRRHDQSYDNEGLKFIIEALIMRKKFCVTQRIMQLSWATHWNRYLRLSRLKLMSVSHSYAPWER